MESLIIGVHTTINNAVQLLQMSSQTTLFWITKAVPYLMQILSLSLSLSLLTPQFSYY